MGKNLVDHKTYVLAGDGCLMEGISQESITLAGKHELSNSLYYGIITASQLMVRFTNRVLQIR